MGFPIIMILIFASIFSGEIGGGVKYTQYFITGMIATGLMTVSFQNLGIWIPIERDRGVLKRYRGTPMPKWVWFAGKVIMVVAIGIAETALLLAVAVALFDLDLPGTAAEVAHLRLGLRARRHRLHAVRHRHLVAGPHRPQRLGRGHPGRPGAPVHLRGVLRLHRPAAPGCSRSRRSSRSSGCARACARSSCPRRFGAQEPGGSFELGRVALVLAPGASSAWCSA